MLLMLGKRFFLYFEGSADAEVEMASFYILFLSEFVVVLIQLDMLRLAHFFAILVGLLLYFFYRR